MATKWLTLSRNLMNYVFSLPVKSSTSPTVGALEGWDAAFKGCKALINNHKNKMIFIHFNYILYIYINIYICFFFFYHFKVHKSQEHQRILQKTLWMWSISTSVYRHETHTARQTDRCIHVALELSRATCSSSSYDCICYSILGFFTVCVCIFPSAQEAKSRLVRPVAVCPAIVQPVIDVEVRIKSDTGFRNKWLFSSMNCKPTE